MSFIAKPKVNFKGVKRNAIGFTARDYEGTMSTLCAGCGHDAISAAFVQAFFELDVAPHKVSKLSGIGCSSKTPAYFLRQAHGVNSVHGRMPSLATGANGANGSQYYVGVSGDGDSLSIGLGHFCHAIRRNLNMLYVIENNGVYGLTKGQFSASADVGSAAKKGEINVHQPIDPVILALSLGCTFVARSFSGDKNQLVPIIKAGLQHRGFAMIDVISPCVTFNDHETSTKSYAATRENMQEVVFADFIPHAEVIEADQRLADVTPVTLHDGSRILLKETDPSYDPTDRINAIDYLMTHQAKQQVVTGLLYINENQGDMHQTLGVTGTALVDVDYARLSPGSDALDKLQSRYC